MTLIMDQPGDVKILPGMAGQARGDRKSAAITGGEGFSVPVSAVAADKEKQNFVWIIDEESGQVSSRKVKTGNLSENGIMVLEGLQPGDWVAIAGVHTLMEGQKVRIAQ